MASGKAALLPGQIDDDETDLTSGPAASDKLTSTPSSSAFRLIPEPKPTQPLPPLIVRSPTSSISSPPASSAAPEGRSSSRDPQTSSAEMEASVGAAQDHSMAQDHSSDTHRPLMRVETFEDDAFPSSSDAERAPKATSSALEQNGFFMVAHDPHEVLSPRTGAPYKRQSFLKPGATSSQSKLNARGLTSRIVIHGNDEEEAVDNASPRGEPGDDCTQTESVQSDELTFTLPEPTSESEETGRMVKETWPTDHVMLLYMLSRYAVCAKTAQEKETWIRQIPLLVLMYEGIAAGVLNFDYAPGAMVIAQEGRPKRIWMNTTQDGKSAIDDLREANLINGLKLSTKDYHSVTAFQVSTRGLLLLSQVSKDVKANVDAFIFAPKPYRHELLKIRYIPIKDEPSPEQAFTGDANMPSWTSTGSSNALTDHPTDGTGTEDEEPDFNEEGRFILESIGYFRYSEVTETEDVSYVSSPFVPQCVRGPEAYQQLSSNAHRAAEAAGGQSNIRDTLSEAITLANPVCLVGEWIPFGSNQIVALNERLGSMDRCQGGLFTSLIDDRPTDTQFEVPPGLTEVRILDYDPVRFINFEAEINFPEEDGIVQVENFGIHLNVDGTIFYGIKVDAIMDKRADSISVDLLSRLLVDIHQDSSEIMDDLLSSYQSSLLDMAFLGDIANRGKFNMIMADQIDPFMPGLEYMDRGDFENELKQVLGDIHCAYDIGDDSVMVVGRDGMLIAGSASKRFEMLFISYFSLLCREMFLRSFFTRIFVLEELLKHIRDLIFRAKEDPNHLVAIRAHLNQATTDLILFTDTLGYLLESLEFIKIPAKSAHAGDEEEAIYSYLDLKKQHHDILLRARDLEKLVHGSKYELVNLRQMAEVLNTTQLESLFKTVEGNTKVLADASIVGKKSGISLELVQLLLAGSFAFTLLDRLPGGTLNVATPDWVQTSLIPKIIDVPLLFFSLNILWMLLGVFAVWKYKQIRHRRSQLGRRMLRLKVNKAIDVEAFEVFLASRVLEKQESVSQVASEVRRVMWQDVSGAPCANVNDHVSRKSRRSRRERMSWKYRAKQWLLRALERLLPKRDPSVPMGNSVAPSDAPVAAAAGVVEDFPVQIEVEYDSRYGFLLFVTFHFNCHTITVSPPLVPPGPSKTQTLVVSLLRRLRIWLRMPAKPSKKAKKTAATTEDDHVIYDTIQAEKRLLRWFAVEMAEHRVIPNAEHFLVSVTD